LTNNLIKHPKFSVCGTEVYFVSLLKCFKCHNFKGYTVSNSESIRPRTL